MLRRRRSTRSELVVANVQAGTLDASVQVGESDPSAQLALHVRSGRLVRIHQAKTLRLREAIRLQRSRVVSAESVQTVRSVQLAVSEIEEIATRAAREVVTDLNASGRTGLNVTVAIGRSASAANVVSGVVTEARARVVNASTTDETVRVASEDLVTHTALRAKVVVRAHNLTVMSVAPALVAGQMSVSTVAQSDVMTGSVDVRTSSVAARGMPGADNLVTDLSPLRVQI